MKNGTVLNMQDIDVPSKANEHADIALAFMVKKKTLTMLHLTFGTPSEAARDEELDALINAEDAALHNHWH